MYSYINLNFEFFRYPTDRIRAKRRTNFWPIRTKKMVSFRCGEATRPPWPESSRTRPYSSRRSNNGARCWRSILWTHSNLRLLYFVEYRLALCLPFTPDPNLKILFIFKIIFAVEKINYKYTGNGFIKCIVENNFCSMFITIILL